jgi:hypothetical protein
VGAYDEGIPSGCSETPRTGCYSVTAATFLLRDRDADGPGLGDKLIWKWRESASTSLPDYGDPTVDSSYSVCVYHGSTSSLAVGALLPAAATCDGGDCWRAGKRGFRFKDRAAALGGVRKLDLKADATPGRAAGRLKGTGEALAYSGLPLSLDVNVQLLRNESLLCWQSIHTADSLKITSSKVFHSKTP